DTEPAKESFEEFFVGVWRSCFNLADLALRISSEDSPTSRSASLCLRCCWRLTRLRAPGGISEQLLSLLLPRETAGQRAPRRRQATEQATGQVRTSMPRLV